MALPYLSSYRDNSGRRITAGRESIARVMAVLGPKPRSNPVRVEWDGRLPYGYHKQGKTLILSAPRKAYREPGKLWGVFIPLYSLHSRRGAGTLRELDEIIRWAREQGADFVATLPLLKRPKGERSPYSPTSRLRWDAPVEGRKEDLYLDLPLGVHPHGEDVRKHPRLFVKGMATGAPPDDFFIRGQNWGFPPLHPWRLRESHYRYFIQVVRHHMKACRILRLDHFMGIHRQYWIPDGRKAEDGVYVRYPAEELTAILCIESHRNRTMIVGEDLGTVTREIRRSMSRHGIYRMYVAQGNRPGPVPSNAFACLNTHDLPTFAGFWKGADIPLRVELDLLDREGAARERTHRERWKTRVARIFRVKRTAEKVRDAWLDHLLRSRAKAVVVNLEDLWLEPRPQNIPGTGPERPNWKRKAKRSVEQIVKMGLEKYGAARR